MAYCKAHQLDMHGFCNRFDAPCIKKNCRFFGVKTNADRIRAMSDEELVGAIFCTVECSCCPVSEVCKSKKGACTDKILEWLKQPAEGE